MNVAYPQDRFEIIVIDNGSTDKTMHIVNSFPVKCYHESKKGIPFARNRGVECSKGEIIAFTDSDCLVSNKWLTELAKTFSGFEADAVEGETLEYPPSTEVEKYMARRRSFSYKMRRFSPLAPYFITANIAFRKSVFDRIDLFDTRFVGGEDVDFSWRFLEEKSLILQFNPNAIVFHRHRQNLKDLFSQHIRVGRGIAQLRSKYPNRLPWSFYKEIAAWCSLLRLSIFAIQKIIAWKFYCKNSKNNDRTKDNYYDLIRKTAVRIGFIWENFKIRLQ